MAKKKSELKFGTGFVQSTMDGTEHVVNVDEKIALPVEFSWKGVMPPVRNQGSSYTCVCQSLTCVLDFIRNSKNQTDGKCNNFSINELFDSRADKKAPGMTFKEALHYLRHHGLGGEKINAYAKVNSSLMAKYALVMFGPIVAGFPVYSANQYAKFWLSGGQFEGGHAITIVGYTEEGFIIRNSWGTSWANGGYIVMPYEDFDKYCYEAWTVMI